MRIDGPSRTRAVLDAVIEPIGRKSSWTAVADILAVRLPLDVANALQAAELTHARYQPTLSMSQPVVYVPKIATAMGLGLVVAGASMAFGVPSSVAEWGMRVTGIAATFAWSPYTAAANALLDTRSPRTKLGVFEYGGEVVPETGTFDVSAPAFLSPLQRAGLFTHESLHVLDFACASHIGTTCSTEPDFAAIVERMRAGEPGLAYPSRFARENALELFAEAGSAYLDLPKKGCVGKAALRTQNPELYAYFEHFFTERLPSVLAKGTITKALDWKTIRESDGYEPGIRARMEAYGAVRDALKLMREGAPDTDQDAAAERVRATMASVAGTRIGLSLLTFNGVMARLDAAKLAFAHKDFAAAQHRKG